MEEPKTMTIVQTAVAMSLDGFIAGPDGGAADVGLHRWLSDGEVPSRVNPRFTLSRPSAAFFDEGVATLGAVVAGRRTYEVSQGWGGRGPMPGLPLFIVTHEAPADVPSGDPPYTFVTEGVEEAVVRARAAAGDRDVHLMGASVIQQAIRARLLDELVISLVPIALGRGVRLLDGLGPGELQLDLQRVIDAPGVTHLSYKVR
jgi:dihydrofolate reductase